MRVGVTKHECMPSDSAQCLSRTAHQQQASKSKRRTRLRRSTILRFYDSLGAARSPCIVKLTQVQFAVAWFILLAIHALASVYFFHVGYLHYFILRTQFEVGMAYLGDRVMDYFQPVMIINGALSAIHALAVLGPILGSLQRRELVFEWPQRRSRVLNLQHHHEQAQQSTKSLTVYEKLFGSSGLLGIEGVYFDMQFRLMEVVEGASQTYQAWKLSHLVPTVLMNRMYVVLLTVSFWSTPLLHRFFRHRTALHRVLSLALDTLLDFIALTVFPLAIFLPYARSFDSDYGDFPVFNYYDDTWFINAVAENQHLFTTNTIDLFANNVPALSVLVSLIALQACLVKRAKAPAMSVTSEVEPATAVVPASARVLLHQDSTLLDRGHIQTSFEKRFHRVFNIIFLVWGLLVLAIHIHATLVANTSPHPNCYLNLRPWFATSYHCAVLEVNCEVLHHDGDAANISDALMDFNSETLRALIITGCASLELPSRLQAFPQLQMLKIYNSTIVDWPDAAALTETHHPSLKLLYVVKTNFSDPSTLPVGLLSDDFPSALQDIELCGTNLVSLPMALTRSWKFIQFVVLENSPGITSFPLALVELGVPQLSLCGNGITSIEDDLLANQSFWTLSLNGNPLTSLPSSVGRMSDLYRLRLGYSGMASLPWWMRANATSVVAAEDTFEQVVDVKLGGTPFCDRLGGDAVDSSVLEAMTNAYFRVDCTTDLGENWPNVYPLAEEETLRSQRLASLR